MATTLPNQKPYSTNVPVVSFPGESESAAKNDPNSPQALMRKTRQMEVQSSVDSQFDSNVPAHEGFNGGVQFSDAIRNTLVILGLAFLGGFLAYRLVTKKLGKRAKLGFFALCIFLSTMLIAQLRKTKNILF